MHLKNNYSLDDEDDGISSESDSISGTTMQFNQSGTMDIEASFKQSFVPSINTFH
jgi:hypothetical protein